MLRQTNGFTIVELITVILLLGLLSAVTIGRSGNNSDFDSSLFASAAAEQYRFAHGLATGRFGDPVSFSISKSANTWQFVTTSSVDGEVRREDMENSSIALVVNNGATSVTVSAATPLNIEFASTGDLSAATVGPLSLQVDLGIELATNGGLARQLCAYPTGYLSTSSCE